MSIEKPTRAEALDTLRKIEHPPLVKFRESLPSLHTSDLIGYLVGSGDQLGEILFPGDPLDTGLSAKAEESVMFAAVAFIGEEIDLRIPPRKP